MIWIFFFLFIYVVRACAVIMRKSREIARENVNIFNLLISNYIFFHMRGSKVFDVS